MINQYILNDTPINLTSDLAGEFPLYLYLAPDKQSLLYSISITELLSDARVKKPLAASAEGISFLLQSGVVPPPKTIYENVFIVGIGDSVEVRTQQNQTQLHFKHEFPFFNAHRLAPEDMQPNEELILQILAEATISRIDESKPTFLFHSAGKDSNSIALAMAEAGWQDKVTLITHKSKGQADESEISKSIAKQLGFKHQILLEVDQLQDQHKRVIEDYFITVPFPSTDNVMLAYPLYAHQMPELKEANIIDGGGNDSYMMTPPSKHEQKVLPLSKLTSKLAFIRGMAASESLLTPVLRTPAEWCGMKGLSYADSKNIFPQSISVYDHWQAESKLRRNWDSFDLKTDILTTITAAELHIRKVRSFADSINSNLVLPFTNQTVAEYFAKMPETYLFDRKQFKNKLILRTLLKERIGLDSDKLGKMGFSYDSRSVVLQNWNWITQEIHQCSLWHQPGMEKVLNRLKSTMQNNHKYAEFSGRLIYRKYLISSWFNRNRFIND